MDKTFLIIDDDINIRKMLTLLIRKNNLGIVVSELDSGEHASEEIMFYNPDIVLIDLLLPTADGIEIIGSARHKGYKGKFVMISQVEDDAVISRAYESGILFFIKKPINNIEAVNVIKGVCHSIDLERSITLIKNTVLNINDRGKPPNGKDIDDQITRIFSDIGILGSSGSGDLRKIIHKVAEIKTRDPFLTYSLQGIYEEMADGECECKDVNTNKKTIEQRIRRTVQKAMETIAELGYADYSNSIFLEYSSVLFDFKQIRQQILHIENSSEEQGKVNIKKFIEGVIAKLNNVNY